MLQSPFFFFFFYSVHLVVLLLKTHIFLRIGGTFFLKIEKKKLNELIISMAQSFVVKLETLRGAMSSDLRALLESLEVKTRARAVPVTN